VIENILDWDSPWELRLGLDQSLYESACEGDVEAIVQVCTYFSSIAHKLHCVCEIWIDRYSYDDNLPLYRIVIIAFIKWMYLGAENSQPDNKERILETLGDKLPGVSPDIYLYALKAIGAHFPHVMDQQSSSDTVFEDERSIWQLVDANLINLRYLQRFSVKEVMGLQLVKIDDGRKSILDERLFLLKELRVIEASMNRFETLPSRIAELKKLKVLNLSYNRIRELPESMKDLENLFWINLSDNQMVSIPKALMEIPNLQCLELAANPLESLPEEISNLTNLCFLDLSETNIKRLPQSIRKLERLQCVLVPDEMITEDFDREMKRLLPGTYVGVPNLMSSFYREGLYQHYASVDLLYTRSIRDLRPYIESVFDEAYDSPLRCTIYGP